MLDLELNKLNEQIELDEAKKDLCLISDRGADFKKVEATILNKEFFAYKNKYTGWTITDKASGLLLKNNFNTLAEARGYLKTLTPEELEKINEVRTTEKYKEQCAKLAAANIDDYELYEDYCCSVFEALEEDEQNILTEITRPTKADSLTQELIDNCKTWYEVGAQLGYPITGHSLSGSAMNQLKTKADELKLDTSKFDKTNTDAEWFVNGKKRNGTWTIRRLLNPDGTLLDANGQVIRIPYKCDTCGISTWNNKNLVLQVHHRDGEHLNNDINNIQLLCPNCHSQTDSYGKNKEKIEKAINED